MLNGIFVPLITPFDERGEVDGDALEKLAGAMVEQGAAGLVALGTTGEVATLDAAERRRVVEICRGIGAPLIVGAGSNDTRATIRALEELPAVSAALVTVPAFLRPSERGVIAHFEALAERTPVPLVIYHVPYRTGQALGPQALRHLGGLPTVAGVKYATGSVDPDVVSLLGDLPPEFEVLAGDDVVASPLLALGASGAILASAHLATGRFAELAGAWRAGDVLRARRLGHRLARLSATLFAEPNPAVVKGVLHARGLIATPEVRLPLLPASRGAVEAALSELEVLAVHPGE